MGFPGFPLFKVGLPARPLGRASPAEGGGPPLGAEAPAERVVRRRPRRGAGGAGGCRRPKREVPAEQVVRRRPRGRCRGAGGSSSPKEGGSGRSAAGSGGAGGSSSPKEGGSGGSGPVQAEREARRLRRKVVQTDRRPVQRSGRLVVSEEVVQADRRTVQAERRLVVFEEGGLADRRPVQAEREARRLRRKVVRADRRPVQAEREARRLRRRWFGQIGGRFRRSGRLVVFEEGEAGRSAAVRRSGRLVVFEEGGAADRRPVRAEREARRLRKKVVGQIEDLSSLALDGGGDTFSIPAPTPSPENFGQPPKQLSDLNNADAGLATDGRFVRVGFREQFLDLIESRLFMVTIATAGGGS